LNSNNVTLADSTINTGTASLKIWNGSTFSTSSNGFHVTGLLPGHGVTNVFYLQNDGEVDLNLTAHVPTAPAVNGITGNDLSKVQVHIKDDHTGHVTYTNLDALTTSTVALGDTFPAGATGDSTTAGTDGNFHVTFDIDPAAATGSSASVGSFNIDLSGTQH
jgi:hypothetical protein